MRIYEILTEIDPVGTLAGEIFDPRNSQTFPQPHRVRVPRNDATPRNPALSPTSGVILRKDPMIAAPLDPMVENAGLPPLPKPGEAPIPAGMVRRFHYTSPEHVESIRQHGLRMEHSQGAKYGDPVAIWSNPEFPYQYGWPRPVVEFWDEPQHYQRHPYARSGDIGPERIVAIHEPWHESYHYAKEEGIPLKNFRRAQGHDDKYRLAADRLEAEGWK